MLNPTVDPRVYRTVIIRHWWPIITFCPVNKLPDLIYVSLVFEGASFIELYQARKELRKLLQGMTIFMEGAAELILKHFPGASEVTVRLLFNRHVVRARTVKHVSFD